MIMKSDGLSEDPVIHMGEGPCVPKCCGHDSMVDIIIAIRVVNVIHH